MAKQIRKISLNLVLVLALAVILTPIVAVASSDGNRAIEVSGLIDVAPVTLSPAPTATQNPIVTPNADRGNTDSPRTGDDANILLYGGLIILAGISLWFLWRKKGKREEKNPG